MSQFCARLSLGKGGENQSKKAKAPAKLSPEDTSPTLRYFAQKNPFCREQLRLFSRQNRILHSLADAEFQRRFCGNLDCLARRRIPAFAGFPLRPNELSKTGEHKLAVSFNLVGRQSCNIFKKLLDLGPLHARPLRKIVNHVGLGHPLFACCRTGRHLWCTTSRNSTKWEN